MLKINTIKPCIKPPSITLVYSNVTPVIQSSPQIPLCCPWHSGHIRFIDADKFFDLNNPILTGGYSCIHLACRNRTEDYFLKFIGHRPYSAIGGGV